jgi:hypothetical protein
MGQLRDYGGWQDQIFKQSGKEIDVSDQHQIVDRAGVGYYKPHLLESQLFQGFAILLEIFHRVVFVNAMGF